MIANSKGRSKSSTEWTIPYFYVNRSVMFKKSDPIHSFPIDVHGIVVGTYDSTGLNDGVIRMKRIHKQRLLVKGKTDKEDLSQLLHGKIQGLMRGDFISRAIVNEHPELGMIHWEAEPSILPSDGEVFAYPTKQGSGVAVLLSTFLTEAIDNGTIAKLMRKYNLV